MQCPTCELELIKITHTEYDGDMGSDESYLACPYGHDLEREVDANAEFGSVIPSINTKESIVL